MKRLQIMDSTTIKLFSNLLLRVWDVIQREGKKKGGIKVHILIHGNERVLSDNRFISTAYAGRICR